MICEYEHIIEFELIDSKTNRENLKYSYSFLNPSVDLGLSLEINLTNFLENVRFDWDTYNLENIEENIEYVKYSFLKCENLKVEKIKKNDVIKDMIQIGVDQNDVEELLNEIIEDLIYQAIEELGELVIYNPRYYFIKDEF